MRLSSGIRWFGATLAFCVSLPANAYLFSIDNFFVERLDAATGALIFNFNDPFDDGSPPPSAPNFSTGGAASYSVSGTPFGVESGGKLSLNGSGASPFIIGVGLFEGAVLNTNTAPASTLGLRKGSLISVTGIFDLTEPLIAEGYGVRLTEATAASDGDDDARIAVRRRPSGEVGVVLTDTDLTGGTITVVDFYLLTAAELSNAQIQLRLEVDEDGNVTGSYGFGAGFTPFGNTMTIFNGETFTRAAFFANGPAIPLPGTIWLGALGLVALAFARRRA